MRQMQPFFSVVLCTYNRAHLLPRALRSLLHQSWQDWEAVLVDDGSTDLTPLLLAAAAAEEPRLRLFRISHRGAGAARAYGVRQCTGSFITFLDSDDEYLPEHLEIRARFLQQHPEIDFLHGGVEVVGNPFVPDRRNPRRWIPIRACVVGGTFVIRRALLLQLGYPRRRFADDAALYDRVLRSGARIAWIDSPTYRYYRTTPDSVCTQVGLSSRTEVRHASVPFRNG